MLPNNIMPTEQDPEPGVNTAMMTNSELAEAIAFAFECTQRESPTGWPRETDGNKVMLAHLTELTAIQAQRAALFIVSPNNQVERPR